MKVLALMQNRTIDAMFAAKMKALVEAREGALLRLLVGFVFVNEGFDLRGNEAADRDISPRSQDLGLPDRLPVDADRNILLHVKNPLLCEARLPARTLGCRGSGILAARLPALAAVLS
jgi:hypothetical protein